MHCDVYELLWILLRIKRLQSQGVEHPLPDLGWSNGEVKEIVGSQNSDCDSKRECSQLPPQASRKRKWA